MFSELQGGRMNKKQKKLVIVVGLVFLTIFAVLSYYFFFAGEHIETAQVKSKDLVVSVTGAGSVEALSKSELFPKTAGVIDQLYVKSGDQVNEGDKLLKLEEGQLRLQVKEAESVLAQAKAAYESAGYQKSSRLLSIEAARSTLKYAEEGLDQALSVRKQVKQQRDQAQKTVTQLSSIGATQTLETAVSNLGRAKEAVSVAEANVISARAGVSQAKNALKQAQAIPSGTGASAAAEAAVEAAQEGVDLAQEALENAVITAPADGTIIINTSASSLLSGGSEKYREGSIVSPESAILSVVAEDLLGFIVEVDEASIPDIELNQVAVISLDAFEGKEIRGSVTHVSTSSQRTLTGGNVFMVEITFDELHEGVRLGMKGEAEIVIDHNPGALVIPLAAFFSQGADEYVYRVVDNRLVKTPIQAGARTGDETEVLSGLTSGDVVVLAGEVALEDDLRVRVQE